MLILRFFFFQAEDGIRDDLVTGVQTCALPISGNSAAQRYERNGFSRKVMKPDSSRLKEMFNTPKVIKQMIPSAQAANIAMSHAFHREFGLQSSSPSTVTGRSWVFSLKTSSVLLRRPSRNESRC